jgi:predicted RNase H-like nuclease (RuvC/YqgF family)
LKVSEEKLGQLKEEHGVECQGLELRMKEKIGDGDEGVRKVYEEGEERCGRLEERMRVRDEERVREVGGLEKEVERWREKCSRLEVRLDESIKSVLELSLMTNELQDSLSYEKTQKETKISAMMDTTRTLQSNLDSLTSKI